MSHFYLVRLFFIDRCKKVPKNGLCQSPKVPFMTESAQVRMTSRVPILSRSYKGVRHWQHPCSNPHLSRCDLLNAHHHAHARVHDRAHTQRHSLRILRTLRARTRIRVEPLSSSRGRPPFPPELQRQPLRLPSQCCVPGSLRCGQVGHGNALRLLLHPSPHDQSCCRPILHLDHLHGRSPRPDATGPPGASQSGVAGSSAKRRFYNGKTCRETLWKQKVRGLLHPLVLCRLADNVGLPDEIIWTVCACTHSLKELNIIRKTNKSFDSSVTMRFIPQWLVDTEDTDSVMRRM